MFHWNTFDIVAELRRAFPDCEIVSDPPGGDYDTDNIGVFRGSRLVRHKGEGYDFTTRESDASCTVFGMVQGHPMADPSDTDVEIVFSCECSKEGMVNASPDDMILCGQVIKILKGLGVRHISSEGWKTYF